jgi:hypothetical protein
MRYHSEITRFFRAFIATARKRGKPRQKHNLEVECGKKRAKRARIDAFSCENEPKIRVFFKFFATPTLATILQLMREPD